MIVHAVTTDDNHIQPTSSRRRLRLPDMDADEKQRALDSIDVDGIEWRRYGSGDGALDVAHVGYHGQPLTLMRSQQSDPPGVVLVFTQSEWDAFRAGARDGEFSEPFGGSTT